MTPVSGQVKIAGHSLSELHQATIATRIGHATARPVMSQGTFSDNVLMPLKYQPLNGVIETADSLESTHARNSFEILDTDWLNFATTGVDDHDQLRNWWLDLVKSMGSDDALFRRGLHQRFDPAEHIDLSAALVKLRPTVAKAVRDAGLDAQA